MVYKLLDLYNSLRELGHPQYIEPFMNKTLTKPPAKPSAKPASKLLGNPPVKPLACGVSRTEADQRVCVLDVYAYVYASQCMYTYMLCEEEDGILAGISSLLPGTWDRNDTEHMEGEGGWAEESVRLAFVL